MKARNISYIKKSRARRLIQRIAETDLRTFLSASFELCRNNVVKRNMQRMIKQLDSTSSYNLSA